MTKGKKVDANEEAEAIPATTAKRTRRSSFDASLEMAREKLEAAYAEAEHLANEIPALKNAVDALEVLVGKKDVTA